jgi:GT2 family glycosyltransferase
MSDDGTRDLIYELITKHPEVKLIDNKKKLTPYAFNLGIINNPKADFYQIIGARHIISENYIDNSLQKIIENNDIWCIGGKIINEYTNLDSQIISYAMGTKLGMGIGNFRTLTKSTYTDTVTSPLYPKWVFDKIGYFDEALVRNQDDDFNYRVTKAGGKIYFNAETSLRYYVRANFKGLKKQFFQYGYWKVFVNKKHKALTTLRQIIPAIFIIYLLSIPFAFLINFNFGAFYSFGFLAYLFLLIFVSVKAQKDFKAFILFKMFMSFPLLHLSYGLGYWNGIISFLLLNQNPSEKNKLLSR